MCGEFIDFSAKKIKNVTSIGILFSRIGGVVFCRDGESFGFFFFFLLRHVLENYDSDIQVLL